MQVVKKILLSLVLIWIAVLIFMPKESLYFTLEKRLAKEGVEISEGEINGGILTLTLEHPVIYLHGIKVAEFDRIEFFTLLLYTTVKASGMKLDSALKRYLPEEAEKIRLRYQLLQPFTLSLSGNASFGSFSGRIDLKAHRIHVDIADPAKLGILKQQLKKGKEGWYYETSF